MDLNEYQKLCLNTWLGQEKLIRSFFGINGESGELAETIKKYYRGDYDQGELKKRAFKELGDILYYITVASHELGFDLNEVGKFNIEKLAKRHNEGKIKGDGDDR